MKLYGALISTSFISWSTGGFSLLEEKAGCTLFRAQGDSRKRSSAAAVSAEWPCCVFATFIITHCSVFPLLSPPAVCNINRLHCILWADGIAIPPSTHGKAEFIERRPIGAFLLGRASARWANRGGGTGPVPPRCAAMRSRDCGRRNANMDPWQGRDLSLQPQ